MDRTAIIGKIESVIKELSDDKLIHLWELMIEVFFDEDGQQLTKETINEIEQARREFGVNATS